MRFGNPMLSCHRQKIILVLCLITGLFLSPLNARKGELIFAFRNYNRPDPERMILVGEIQSKTKMPELHDKESPFIGYDNRLDLVTVKVVDRRGIKVGQKLYIIDKDPFHHKFKDGLVVGEIEVISILNSPFYGWVLTGKGILLRVRKGHFVARTLDTERLERAFVLKKRGDHFAARGDFKRALSSYNDALIADKTLPEASAALGDLYLKMAQASGRESPVRSMAAYRRSWRSRVNFRYQHDRMQYYQNYIKALLLYYNTRILESTREDKLEKYLSLILTIVKESKQIQSGANWMLLAEAQARYHRYRLFAAETIAEERAQRDQDYERIGDILKKMIEAKQQSAWLSHLGILYYKAMLDQTAKNTKQDLKNRNRLKYVLSVLIRQYNLFHQEIKRDPEVDRIILELEEAS